MRLYCDIGEGELVELGMVKTIGKGDIVIRTKSVYHDDHLAEMEKMLNDKFGRKVILLDARFGEIMVVPPEKEPVGISRRP